MISCCHCGNDQEELNVIALEENKYDVSYLPETKGFKGQMVVELVGLNSTDSENYIDVVCTSCGKLIIRVDNFTDLEKYIKNQLEAQ